jgi:hypothetical protein
MQQANNAMLLGVADSAEEFETLAKIAVDRGRAMGISMEYAFESIVKGVGRLSPLILDNLGIVLDADTTYKKYAETIGKTADSLTDVEKRAALISRLKEEVSDFDSSSVMDAAASWERLSASMTNAIAVAGEWLNENTLLIEQVSGLSDVLDMLAGNFSEDTNAKIRGLTAELGIAQEQLALYKRMMADLEKEKTSNPLSSAMKDISEMGVQKGIDDWQAKVESLIERLDKLKAANASVKDDMENVAVYREISALKELEAEYSKVGDAVVNWYAKSLKISNDEARAQIQTTIQLKGSWEAAAPAIAAAGNAAVLAAQRIAQATSLLNSALSSIQGAALQAYSDSGYNPAIIEQYQAVNVQAEALRSTVENMDPVEASFYMRQFTDQASEGFKAVSEYANQTEQSIGGSAKATKQLTKEFQSLSGSISSIIGSAMSDFGGADLSEFLPYQDAPAEDARRIASVMVEGWDSEWVDYFKTKFPDLFTKYMGDAGGDIQKASAMLLKDFQDGMRPELIDKDKVKELAKRMFLADQETSKMVDEIARDLAAEMGISIEEATAAVGGAAGVKKKPMTREEVEKLFGGIDMAPKWDMADSKQKFIDAGKAAGVLDESGNILVPVKITFDTMEGNTISGDYQIKISGFTFSDLATMKSNIATELGEIQLNFSSKPTTAFYQGLQTNVYDYVSGKTAAVSIVPAAYDPKIFDNWVAGAESFITAIDINVNPTMTTETFEAVFSPIRDALKDTFVTQETLDQMVYNMAAGLGLGIFNKQEEFKWQAPYIANIMITSFEDKNIGQLLANTIANQLTEAKRTFEISAGNSARTWGNAFLDTVRGSVPMELINILTDLVTPQVAKKVGETKDRGKSE